MARFDSRRLSPTARAVLRSGAVLGARGRCTLPRALSGAALASVLLSLAERGLVRVDWTSPGSAGIAGGYLGEITERGREALGTWRLS